KNFNKKVESLGIAFNLVDSLIDVNETASSIRQSYPNLKIIVRPHPSDTRNFILFEETGVEWSDPKREDAFEFLIRIDCLIAGDSNIHLEATLLNIASVYYKFDGIHSDYYGFVRNGLIDASEDIKKLLKKIGELMDLKMNNSNRALYYNSAINS